tara:strand:+ start:5866 stop:6048 length:183 start_codon:yes stop_codon:yes gene_type:complete
MDPSFRDNIYPESGTIGYDGKGWYYFHGGQLWGPFDSEEEAKKGEDKSTSVDEWENEGGR